MREIAKLTSDNQTLSKQLEVLHTSLQGGAAEGSPELKLSELRKQVVGLDVS